MEYSKKEAFEHLSQIKSVLVDTSVMIYPPKSFISWGIISGLIILFVSDFFSIPLLVGWFI